MYQFAVSRMLARARVTNSPQQDRWITRVCTLCEMHKFCARACSNRSPRCYIVRSTLRTRPPTAICRLLTQSFVTSPKRHAGLIEDRWRSKTRL